MWMYCVTLFFPEYLPADVDGKKEGNWQEEAGEGSDGDGEDAEIPSFQDARTGLGSTPVFQFQWSVYVEVSTHDI